MSFRGDDDAREERMRALEKQLAQARREVSALRPKAARLAEVEKENQRLLADATRAASPAVPEPTPAKQSKPPAPLSAPSSPTVQTPRASLGPGEWSVMIALAVLVIGAVAAVVISAQ